MMNMKPCETIWLFLIMFPVLTGLMSVALGDDAQEENVAIEIQMVPEKGIPPLPAKLASDSNHPNWIFGLDVRFVFFSNQKELGRRGWSLRAKDYLDGTAHCQVKHPNVIIKERGWNAEDVSSVRLFIALSSSPLFPWTGEVEATLETIGDDEIKLVMPVRYVRSAAEGDPSRKMRFRLLSGSTGEPLPGFDLMLRSPQWSRHFRQDVETDDQGFFEALVYGDEDIVVEQRPPSVFRPDQVRPTTVSKELVARHLKEGKPLLVKGTVPRLTGTLSAGDPEQDAIIAQLKGWAFVRYDYGENREFSKRVAIEHGRFSLFADSRSLKKGMKTSLVRLGGDFENYVLTTEATFPLPDVGENRRIVVPVAAPKAVEVRVEARAKTGGASVGGARIALLRLGGKPVRLTTESNGQAVASVPAGEYRVAVAAPGYADSVRDERIVKPETLKFDLLKTVSFEIVAEGEGLDGLEAAMLASTETETLLLADFAAGQTRAMVKDVPEGRAVAMIGNRQGDIVGVEGVNVVEQGRARMALGKPVTLKANFKADEKTRARVSILLVDKETRVPMHPLRPAGEPLELRVPRRAYDAYAVVPRELLARNEADEMEEDFAQPPEVWVRVGEVDLRSAAAATPENVSWELPKTYKPLRKSDVLHPAFR